MSNSRSGRLLLVLAAVLALSLFPNHAIQAARGVPGSVEFGFGASIHPDGPFFSEALFLTNSLQLDWLAVDISWQSLQPSPDQSGDWTALDRVMQYAAQNQIPVLARLTDAPSWATSEMGPDPIKASTFTSALVGRYADIVQAVELFPSANTNRGWGSVPNPAAYTALFSTVNQNLISQGKSILLVAGGLQPLPSDYAAGGMDDAAFLQGLYDAGLRDQMPLIGLELVNLHGEPFTSPILDDPTLLRHYEQIRQVMLANDHQDGLLWITRLSVHSGTIDSAYPNNMSLQEQADWFNLAAAQIRSQLYIGVTIFQSLNPASTDGNPQGESAILLGSAEYHPFYPMLKAFVQQNHPDEDKGKPGRPKDTTLFKTKS